MSHTPRPHGEIVRVLAGRLSQGEVVAVDNRQCFPEVGGSHGCLYGHDLHLAGIVVAVPSGKDRFGEA